MLSKRNRLGSEFFKNLFKKGVIVDSQYFSIKYVKGNKEDFKISIIVPKKVSLKAVERNLLKRRFLSIVLEEKSLLIKGFSYVFYLKKGVDSISRDAIKTNIIEKIRKIYEENS